jgi:hypothetical protein
MISLYEREKKVSLADKTREGMIPWRLSSAFFSAPSCSWNLFNSEPVKWQKAFREI